MFFFPDKKRFTCDECLISFQQAEQLRSHQISVHQVIQSFVCEDCHQHFGAAATFELHVLTHKVERPYACDLCDRTFSMLYYLNVHKRNDHSDVQTQQCSECGKHFASKRTLLYHLATHKNEESYPCVLCKKWFQGIKNLVDHQKAIHSDRVMHVCMKCGKNFNSSSNLNRHALQHILPKKSNHWTVVFRRASSSLTIYSYQSLLSCQDTICLMKIHTQFWSRPKCARA